MQPPLEHVGGRTTNRTKKEGLVEEAPLTRETSRSRGGQQIVVNQLNDYDCVGPAERLS